MSKELTREEFRAEIRRRLEERAKERDEAMQKAQGYQAPRYDDVYWKGLEWLNSL